MSTLDDQNVIYSCHTFVRVRRPRNSWVSWNNRLGGGPVLVVRPGWFEVSAPQGMMMESRHLLIRSEGALMWFDKVGWAGTPFDRKECIHVAGRDRKGNVEMALSPVGEMQEAWQALLESGVHNEGDWQFPTSKKDE